MPGLAGIYDPRADAPEIGQVLERMRRVMDVPAFPCHARTAVDHGIGCIQLRRYGEGGSRLPGSEGPQPCTWAACDGEIYNRSELRALAAPRDESAPHDDELCLALYRRDGASFVQRINGQFTLAIYRGATRSLLIATDRYGYRPLFWAQVGSRVLFATEMKAVLVALDTTPAFDGLGILELLTYGHALGDRTWLEPIRVVDAGTLLEFSPAGIARQRYFRVRFQARAETGTLDGFAAELGRTLVCATERMSQGAGRIGVLVSGGLDSRAVLLAAAAHRRPAAAFTFGAAGSRDVRYGGELARAAGVPHLHLPYEPGYLGRALAPVVWRTEGLVPFASATFTSMAFHPALGAHADVLLYGSCGDCLSGARVRPDGARHRSPEAIVDRVLGRFRAVAPPVVRSVLTAGFFARVAADLTEAERRTVADTDQEQAADIVDVWNMDNRQRRCTFQSAAVDRFRFAVRAPFLDNDVVDHLTQAPVRWRFQQRAYKRMIVGRFPAAAHVPWAYTGRPIQTCLAGDLVHFAWRYANTHAPGHWGQAALTRDQFRDIDADVRSDTGVAAGLHAWVASRWFPGDVFDRRGIEDVLHRHESGDNRVTPLVMMLATLATAFRLFLVESTGALPPEAAPIV